MNPSSSLEEIAKLNPKQKVALKKLGISTVRDVLYHFPTRYSDLSVIKNIKDLVAGDRAIVYGKIKSLKTSKGFRKKIAIGEATIEDVTGKIKITWFNQPYLAKMFEVGNSIKVAGKVTMGKNGIYLANPEIEKTADLPIDSHDSLFQKEGAHAESSMYPVYPESRGVTSKFFYHLIGKIIKSGIIEQIEDTIPEDVLKKYSLPTLKTALVWLHSPKKEDQAEMARKRFAFEEVFFIQLREQKERIAYEKNKSFILNKDNVGVEKFLSRFPFKPTKAQSGAIDKIFEDFSSGRPMLRLLEGDVGSGKTLVAATASYAVATSRPAGQNFGNLQVAYMAPTEILAKQHFESFISYFSHLPIQIGLMTSSGCKKFPSKVDPSGATDISRTQLLKWVAEGTIPIVIGTHALIQKSVKFKHLALAIIDEQHRFGTKQRFNLSHREAKDSIVPHLLSMTATPIPRTLTLTIYGNLDLTLLDEMPAGRKQIITEIVLPGKREHVYEKVREELSKGRQAYVICPRINEPDMTKEMALLAKSVKEEAKRLSKDVFPNHRIEILHSKMTDSEKENIMGEFTSGDIDILVATSMVEVGVNVPNATVIIIEGAERFGLAQLHQLRGRVLRSTHQAYCFLFSETKSDKSIERLRAIEKAKNGFELSELDLMLRGAGELGGKKQWGISDLGMEAIKNIKMVEAARTEAGIIMKKDSTLKTFPLLEKNLAKHKAPVHLE